MTDDILTIHDLANYLKINEKTAYRLVSEGKIPGFKVGGSWRFNRDEIVSWAKSKQKESDKTNAS
jgi:excisionase family DNA binding protein